MTLSITERSGAESGTGFAIETAFGTIKTPTSWAWMTGNTMAHDPSWFSPPVIMGSRDKQVFNLYGLEKNEGTVDGLLAPSNAAELIVAAVGTDAISGTGPYVHTISQASTLASLTCEKVIGGYQSVQYAGCRVNKLTIKAAVGEEAVTMQADLMAQSATVLATPTTASFVSESPFTFVESTVTLFGNARADVKSIELVIENEVKATGSFTGSAQPTFLTAVTVKVSGKADVVWSSLNDPTYGDFSTMTGKTLGALDLKFAHAGGDSVELTCPQVTLAKVGEDIKLTDVVLGTLEFQATKNLTSGYTIQAILTNNVATAY